MATFQKKTWKNRTSEYPVRRRLSIISDEGSQLVADVSREEGTVSQVGDAFSAANMNDLESRIEDAFENTGGGNFVGVRYHASLVDYPDLPCWEDMTAEQKAKYDQSSGATVNFVDDELPSDIIGDTDISAIADGTLTGAVAEHDEQIVDLENALTHTTDISLTPLNSSDLSSIKIRKEANNMVHIDGAIILGASCASGGNLNVANFPSTIEPQVSREVFSIGYCYDKYITCLFYKSGDYLQLYKPSGNLASGDLVTISMHYKAKN